MKKLLNELRWLVKDDLVKYDLQLNASLKSDVKLINTIVNYIISRKGKSFRPILCFLATRLFGSPNDKTYIAASLLEIIHVATLLHDDVVDESDYRRGWPSVNRVWKNKLSILVGDYMFSKSLVNMVEINESKLFHILSKTAEKLSSGEIMQLESSFKYSLSEKKYFEIISNKTASLFSASCTVGIATISNEEEQIKNMEKFGNLLGLCFQIKDDLLDIMGSIDGMGKPLNLDVKKNLFTLPLIHVIENVSNADAQKIKHLIKRNNTKELKKIIILNNGIDYAENKIKEFSDKAVNLLDSLGSSSYKKALINALKFNLERVH